MGVKGSKLYRRVFVMGCILDSKGCKVSSCGQGRHRSDYIETQADLRRPRAYMSEGSFSYVAAQ